MSCNVVQHGVKMTQVSVNVGSANGAIACVATEAVSQDGDSKVTDGGCRVAQGIL